MRSQDSEEVADESLDVKAFCDLHGITFRNAEFHDRIAAAFQDAGFSVLSVERCGYCWQATVNSREIAHLPASALRSRMKNLLRSAGIRLHRHEPIIAKNSQHLLVMFDNDDGVSEIGLGIRYCRMHHGRTLKLREEYELSPPDNYPREGHDLIPS